MRHINIIGHQNPDTDSICSALAYAWLKNRGSLEGMYEARRAGHVNRETRFVLQHFGVEPPRLCTDVSPQIKDIDIRKQPGIDGEMSVRAAWNLMRDVEIDTLCIVGKDNELQGLITIKDIADANMDLFDTAVLAAANTRCRNLLETLEAELVVGDADARIDSGRICIGSSPEIMEELVRPGDLVLVSNRYETQMCAIDCGAQAIVVCCGSAVPRTIIARAQEKGCAVLATPYDTYAAARLVSTAAPVRHFMRTKELLKFSVNTPIEDAKKVMASVRHRYFPILDENGKYCGVVSRRNLLNLHRKQVILVDHNERTQAVDGLEEADILEIIDHHRIGNLETTGPVYFRNVPVGCTATILYQMYEEQGLTPSREIAGLLLSAILSDTLVFRSPTSTPQDEAAAKALAELAGEDIPSYAEQMFEAGADLTGRTAEDVFSSDFKAFSRGDVRFGVGQSTYMTDKSRAAAEALVQPFLPEASRREGLPLIFYMFTDMKTQSTDLMFYGHNAEEIVRDAFHVEPEGSMARLPGVVSRKKQLIPPLLAALQARQYGCYRLLWQTGNLRRGGVTPPYEQNKNSAAFFCKAAQFLCDFFDDFADGGTYGHKRRGQHKADDQIHREHCCQRQGKPLHKGQIHQRQQNMVHQVHAIAPACQSPQGGAERRGQALPGQIHNPEQHRGQHQQHRKARHGGNPQKREHGKPGKQAFRRQAVLF